MFVLKVVQALQKHGVDYAIAGGFAVALHGAVRGTLDVDLVVRRTEKDFARVEAALKSIGLESRVPVSAAEVVQFREEYIKNKNMMAWGFVNPHRTSEMVDVILTKDLREVKVQSIAYGKHRIRIVGILDLIRMKEESHRPQDRSDAAALREIRRRSAK